MKKFLIGLFLLVVMAGSGYADEKDDLAINAAMAFAGLIDDGNIQAAYWVGSPLLQLANEEQGWLNKTARTQKVLGKVLERKLKKVRSVTSPADFPDDDYRIMLFDARTEHKDKAAEVILAHKVNGIWQICSYAIR